MLTFAIICCALGSIPSVLLLVNLCRYDRAPKPLAGALPRVSVLIPARNEESNIGACLKSVLANRDVSLEVLVLDDHSSDRTAAIVGEYASKDGRVRLIPSRPLIRGWCGKQFACHQLSQHADAPYFIFIDADVRLSADALARSIAFLERSGADLISGVPRQITETFSEKLLIPLIHFILLGYLPFGFMRRFKSAAFAAGCGQLIVVRAERYHAAGGHQAIASSSHDGIRLPRAFRQRGFITDLYDPTDLAWCRMYPNSRAVWSGVAKNATEGIAKPALILPFTILFLLGQVLPPFIFVSGLFGGVPPSISVILGVVTGITYAARFVCAQRFSQSWLGAVLHPIALFAFLVIQWWALYQEKRGRVFIWKGRPKPTFVG